jgi:glutamine amidotransferase
MIAIVDYGVGNLFSLKSSLQKIGAEAVVTADEETLQRAERIILPGVGAFGDAADKLRAAGLDKLLVREAEAGKPLLGICLGMQLLFEKGLEYGSHRGLGLIPGEVTAMAPRVPAGYKIPQMGWNALSFAKPVHPIFSTVPDGSFVYFVHSYSAVCPEEYVIAETDYGVPITAAAARRNVVGCQFHPEKSGPVGLRILKAFCEMEAGA